MEAEASYNFEEFVDVLKHTVRLQASQEKYCNFQILDSLVNIRRTSIGDTTDIDKILLALLGNISKHKHTSLVPETERRALRENSYELRSRNGNRHEHRLAESIFKRTMQINTIRKNQLAVMNLIANSYDNAVKVGLSNINPQRIHTRITALKASWQKFDLNHDAITLAIAHLSSSDKRLLHSHSYFIDNLYSMTHECYLDALEKMTSFLESDHIDVAGSSSLKSVSHPSSVPTFIQHTRLPRITLPKFNGSPADWLSFKDLFSSLVVANPTLTSIKKLQYLKTSLVGSAAHLIKNTTLTSDNYQKAWDSLVSFYENKRLLVNSALHSLLTLKRMTKESSTELEHLYTNLVQIYRTLETLQRPVDTWDDFLIFIAVQRLDSESVKAWEQNLGSSKEPPPWNQFTAFIITKLLSLQAFEKSRTGKLASHVPQKAIKAHYQGKTENKVSINSGSCVLYSSNHYIMTCPQYSQKTVPQPYTSNARVNAQVKKENNTDIQDDIMDSSHPNPMYEEIVEEISFACCGGNLARCLEAIQQRVRNYYRTKHPDKYVDCTLKLIRYNVPSDECTSAQEDNGSHWCREGGG